MSYQDYMNGYNRKTVTTKPNDDYKLGNKHYSDGWVKWTESEFKAGGSRVAGVLYVDDMVVHNGTGLTGVDNGQVGVVRKIIKDFADVCFDASTKSTHRCRLTELTLYSEHPSAASGAQREKLSVLPYDLVPFQEITDAFARVAEYGAKKYAPWNWSKGLSRVQLCCSLLRHTFAYIRGQDYDNGPKGSGLLHTDHILWNAAALSHNVHHNLEDGRRPEPPREYKGDDSCN